MIYESAKWGGYFIDYSEWGLQYLSSFRELSFDGIRSHSSPENFGKYFAHYYYIYIYICM
nr:hypothetical protein Q903MT_gene3489 [Picea sitchensis]